MNTSQELWQEVHQQSHQWIWSRNGYFLRLTLCQSNMARIEYFYGEDMPARSWSVVPDNDSWQSVATSVEHIDTVTQIRTDAGSFVFDRAAGTVRWIDAQGKVFCADALAPELNSEITRVVKQITPKEGFYGFGERTGPLEKSGLCYTNWTLDPEYPHTHRVDNMYTAFPIYMSIQPGLAYGVFFNTTWRSAFDIGRTDVTLLEWVTDGPKIDYFVVFGSHPADVTQGWHTLLGATPMPPMWSLGYHQSRWSYESEPVIRELMAEFRGRSIPCDAIHFDIDYMQGYRVFTWNNTHFPNPEQLLADMHAKGFRCVTIIDPGVKTDSDYAVFQAGLEKDLFIRRADGSLFSGYVWPDDSAFADYTRADVREWWGDLHQSLLDIGVDGIWNDMNEPTVFERPFSEGGGNAGTIDLDAPQGAEGERTIHAEVHNLYGLLMGRATREGLQRHQPNQRPFVLTRSGFAGLQRWATLWTGDNTALWEHLEMTLPQIANIGLSGVPFCGVDIGGFFDDATPELWARWIQIGAFLPFCRGHSCSGTRPAEPWMFGEQTEAIARSYITLRYRLLPYLYTLFHQAATTGAPIIRPLIYEFPADLQVRESLDQAMCGPQLLLAPIVRPGVTHRAVYLPEGVWYDWWTGERLQGPIHILAHAPLERLPLYVRGGSILTLGPAMQYTGEKPLDTLTLDVYPAGSSSWTLYEDDGTSWEFQQGAFAQTRFSCHESDAGITVEIDAREGAWQPAERSFLVNIHGSQPRRVLIDDQAVDAWVYEDRSLALMLPDDGQAHRIVCEGMQA